MTADAARTIRRACSTALLLALAAGTAFARDTSSLEELLQRNPRGVEIVEDMARGGAEEAMLLLCQARSRSGEDAASSSRLRWCSRAALLGHSAALRELGFQLLADRDRARVREGVTLLAVSEVAGHPLAALEVALLPDFFDVSPGDLGRARKEAIRRVNAGSFHDPATLGFAFELTDAERDTLRGRRLEYLQTTAALRSPDQGLAGLAARRRQAERGQLVEEETRRLHRERLEAKDALQARLSADLKRASLEPERSDRDTRARADRRERRRIAAELHTDRVEPADVRKIEAHLAGQLERINRHRSAEAALTLDDLSLPWRDPANARRGFDPGAPQPR